MKLKYFLIIPLLLAVCTFHPDIMDGINQVFETYQWLVLILALVYTVILVVTIVVYCNPFNFDGKQKVKGRGIEGNGFWIEMETIN